MRTFQLVSSVIFLALFLQCGDAEKNVSKKASSSVSSAKSEAVKTASDPALAATPHQAQDTLIIIARCIEIPGTFVKNDAYDYVYIMKYRVMKIIKGAYSGQEILVGHYNPLIPRQQITDEMAPFARGNVTRFETGAKHILTLVTPVERVWKKAVEDEYADSDLEKYYALKADVAQ